MNFNWLFRIFPWNRSEYLLEKHYAQNIKQEDVQLALIRDIKSGIIQFRYYGDSSFGHQRKRHFSKFRLIKFWFEYAPFGTFAYLMIGKTDYAQSINRIKYEDEICQAIQEQIKYQKLK